MNFDQAFAIVIDKRHEGGLSMDPNDRGNWTGGAVGLGRLAGSKYGISAAQYPTEDIKNLTVDRARTIYLRDYWGPAGCDAMPDEAKLQVFDMAINSGYGNTVRTLQRAVGATPDGRLGPLTLQAVQSMPPDRFISRFNGARLAFLAASPQWDGNSRGYANRIAANLMGVST